MIENCLKSVLKCVSNLIIYIAKKKVIGYKFSIKYASKDSVWWKKCKEK